MGFSTSGSAVVVLLGLFVALGTFYTAGANTLERLSAAERAQADRLESVQETSLTVTSVTLSGSTTNCDVAVRVNNTGSTELSLAETTFMVENTVQTGWRDAATVDGDATTELWLPGEQLVATAVDLPQPPTSVAVVSKSGVTARGDTEGRAC